MLNDSDALEMYRGDFKTFAFEASINEVRIDLTGLTVRFAVYERWPGGDVANDNGAIIFKETGGSGIALTDPSNGEFEIDIDPADTYSLDIPDGEKRFVYGIEYLPTTGNPVTIGRGRFVVYADAVRSS